MNDPNPKTSDAQAGSARRILTWLSDYAWLMAGCLFVLVAVRSGADRAEDTGMRENRKRIEEMPRTDRERLQHNQTEFQKLNDQEEKRLRELHEAVNRDEHLNRTLTAWHNWLATLTIEQREEIFQAKNHRERMDAIHRLRQDEHGRRGPPGRHMLDPQLFRSQKQPVRFTPEDYQAMLKVAARWCDVPVEPERDDPKAKLSHHALIVTRLLDRVFPGWDQPGDPRQSRSRPDMPRELRDDLVAVLSDPVVQRAFRDRPEFPQGASPGAIQSMMLMSFFARGLFEETRKVAGVKPLTEDERMAAYLRLPEKARLEFDRLPREQFDFRIRWVTTLKSLDGETSERLGRLTSLFERITSRRPGGGQGQGRRPPEGDGQRRPGDRPPGRFGEGRPGDRDRPPFRGDGDRPPGNQPRNDAGRE